MSAKLHFKYIRLAQRLCSIGRDLQKYYLLQNRWRFAHRKLLH